MDLLLIGPTGVGKGTQAIQLAARYGIVHVASGDLFRANIRDETPLGLMAKAFVERGELVPDRIVSDMVLDRVLSVPGVLLDGYPRTIPQAQDLQNRMAEAGRRIEAVILLTAQRQALLRRIVGRETCVLCSRSYNVYYHPSLIEAVCDICGGPLHTRADDNLDTARHRLEVYEEQTRPLAAFYESLSVLVEVDGSGEPDDVAALVNAAVERMAAQQPARSTA